MSSVFSDSSVCVPVSMSREDEEEEDEEIHHGGRGRKKIMIQKIEDPKTRQV